MARYLIVFFFLISVQQAKGQWGLTSNVQASYSGVSQNLRCIYGLKSFQFEVGPKISLSQSKLPWSNAPGVSVSASYSKDFGKVFVLSEYIGFGQAHVFETYAGYGVKFNLFEKFEFTSGLGFGPYREKASTSGFVVNGVAYCANAGFTYRF